MNSDQGGSDSSASRNEADRRSLFFLLLAAIIGIGLGSLAGAGWFDNDHLPGTVVARVNGKYIQLREYHRALRLLDSERREPIREQDRTLVLERMVQEELLLQHGVASGLMRSDRAVRAAVIQSILAGLMVEFEAGAGEVVSKNSAPGMIKATTTGEVAGTEETTYDARLREYLGQLREVAVVRWVAGDSSP